MPDGQKAYSMTRPIRLEHLADCTEWWGGPNREGRQESPRAWKVSAEEVNHLQTCFGARCDRTAQVWQPQNENECPTATGDRGERRGYA